MVSISAKPIFVSTDHGLFALESRGGSYAQRLIGLHDKGPLTAVCFHEKKPRHLFIASRKKGIYQSENGGQVWRAQKGDVNSEEIWTMVCHPRSADLFVGTGPASVYRMGADRSGWERCAALPSIASAPALREHERVRAIGLHFASSNLVFCAIEGGYVARSLDSGRTWKLLLTGLSAGVNCILPLSDNPARLVCGTRDGVYISHDAGDHFSQVPLPNGQVSVVAMESHFSRPDRVFALTAGNSAFLHLSEDQGRSWKSLENLFAGEPLTGPSALCLHPIESDLVAVGFGNGDVWLSTNGGKQFEKIAKGLPHVTGLSFQP